MSSKHSFWITDHIYDLKNNLKPHLAEKKYMALIQNKNGKREYCFYDKRIDLEMAAAGFNFTILEVGAVPQ